MSLRTVRNDIKNKTLPALYLWYGEDRYALTEALRLLKGVFLAEDPSGSNIETFNGKEVNWNSVVEIANTPSFFSRKLVLVDDISIFDQSRTKNQEEELKADLEEERGSSKEEVELLSQYLKDPNPMTCLLLISNKVNKGRRIFKEIVNNGKVLEFSYPQKSAEWIRWIQEEARDKGKKIKAPAAAFLVEWSGHNTGILSRELEKLALYTAEREEIGLEDIKKVAVPLVETKIFDMLDAIALGNVRQALLKLAEILTLEKYYIRVYTMIVRQIRLLLAANLIRKKAGTAENLSETTGIKRFEANKIFNQASRFTPEKLERALEICMETEVALKSSGGNPDFLLEIMVIKLCRH